MVSTFEIHVAAPFVAPPFKLATANGGSGRLQAYWRSATKNASITKDSDLPIGEAGYATTAVEWEAVLQALATFGYSVQRRSKANVDMALEKCGDGRTWSSFGDDVMVQRVTHQRWVKDGKWDAMKSVLKALRAAHGGQDAHPGTTG